ncbi:hypothetical protein NE237_014220 [Protea cynaroides]|uniref:Uncharacterized protein n=1 Tax=Protea cynaroides TaxID=273540 RepID=A0A9Q0GKK5_9MAGN|nr:hypothetical protein NE237_014220 [Protea cynaroides]
MRRLHHYHMLSRLLQLQLLLRKRKRRKKMKEIRLVSKSSILPNKKMNNALSIWKQRNNEDQAARIVLDDTGSSASMDDRPINNLGFSYTAFGHGAGNSLATPIIAQTTSAVSEIKPQPVSNSSRGTLMGMIRGSGRGVLKFDSILSGRPSMSSPVITSTAGTSAVNPDTHTIQIPFRTDASVLGSYTPPVATGSGKRRFSEQPAASNSEQPQTTYRDRAAERRSLYGSSSPSMGDALANSSKHV